MIRFDARGLIPLICRLGLTGGLLMALFLAGCTNAPTPNTNGQPQAAASPTSAVKKEGNFITADPNPVNAGAGGVGKTKVSWGTIEKPADLHIYVAADNANETIFASSGGAGSEDAPWIREGFKYEFRLYSGAGPNRKLLDKVVVTGQK
jgi:hypothetical protein